MDVYRSSEELGQPVVLSLHDVMPETLDRVEGILNEWAAQGLPPATLLVVPGRDWRAEQLDRLRAFAAGGHELAAHGWRHHCDRYRNLHHRLHGALLSRRAAEHLALDRPRRIALMQRTHAWFGAHDLPSPRLYVPPAWALGKVDPQALASLPYSRIEVLRGVLELPAGRLRPLPLTGYEADTAWRAGVLRRWNTAQLRRARRTGRPLRIGVHPHDYELKLGNELRDLLRQPLQYLDYGQALDSAAT